jgi:hypothetical protein
MATPAAEIAPQSGRRKLIGSEADFSASRRQYQPSTEWRLKMSKRILTAVLLGLAVASHGVLAQDMGTTDGDRNAQQQQADQKRQADQKALDDYWATHNDDAPGYPFNP